MSDTPIAADGAADLNIQWEAGTSSTWYIELQRFGADYVTQGVQLENDNEIREGILIINWGFDHQSSDGSFGTTGDPFHSTSYFLEGAARSCLLLKNYHAYTYAPNYTYYNSVVSNWTPKIEAAATWLTEPAVVAAGAAEEQPYGHRRWLLAACLGESYGVTGDAPLLTESETYLVSGLGFQLANGWQAAIPPANAKGVVAPATLVAPGVQPPKGYWKLISADGVNPEDDGYDVSYQGLGLIMATRYIPYCPADFLSQLKASIVGGYNWELQWIANTGVVSWYGSSRIGIETTRSGAVKTVDFGTIADGLALAATAVNVPEYAIYSIWIDLPTTTPSSYVPSADGAVGTNIAYESGKQTTYDISQQQAALDYINAGIAHENDGWVRTGCAILNWGFAKEASNGTFPGASGSYWQPVMFGEAAACIGLQLQRYSPTTYTLDATYYQSEIATIESKVTSMVQWEMGSNYSSVEAQLSTSTSHTFAFAAFLSEYKKMIPTVTNPKATVDALAKTAMALQQSNGEEPEKGVASPNDQAYGILFSERLYASLSDATMAPSVASSISGALGWMTRYVNSGGLVVEITDPATGHIQQGFTNSFKATQSPTSVEIGTKMLTPLTPYVVGAPLN